MILYNVTIGIDKEIENEWVIWMKSQHIPDVMNTRIFVGYKFYKVLTHEEDASPSYCVQYFVPSIEEFNEYLNLHAPKLIEEHRLKFKDRHVAFRTLLEEVD
jgi:Domain of unknown function (DUF4286)